MKITAITKPINKSHKVLLGTIAATALALMPMSNLNAQETNKDKVESVSNKSSFTDKNILGLLALGAITLGGICALGHNSEKQQNKKSIMRVIKNLEKSRNNYWETLEYYDRKHKSFPRIGSYCLEEKICIIKIAELDREIKKYKKLLNSK